jgi:hypothetical protein
MEASSPKTIGYDSEIVTDIGKKLGVRVTSQF